MKTIKCSCGKKVEVKEFFDKEEIDQFVSSIKLNHSISKKKFFKKVDELKGVFYGNIR